MLTGMRRSAQAAGADVSRAMASTRGGQRGVAACPGPSRAGESSAPGQMGATRRGEWEGGLPAPRHPGVLFVVQHHWFPAGRPSSQRARRGLPASGIGPAERGLHDIAPRSPGHPPRFLADLGSQCGAHRSSSEDGTDSLSFPRMVTLEQHLCLPVPALLLYV